MRSTFNVSFQVRKNRVSKDGLSPIDVVITVNTERSTMTTGKKIKPDSWDLARQRVKSKTEEARLINEYLQSIKNKLLECEADLLNHGYLVTASLLRDAYLNNVEVLKDKTLLEVFAEHNRQQKEMLDNGKLSKATLFISEYTLTLITDFIKDHYKRNDIYLKELNINFIKEFHLVLLKRMKQNSSTKHIKLLKKIINIAIANSDITFNPFGTYKAERDPVEIDFLDEEELRKVINFDTPLPRLEKAKDMFLFGCFTGLSYIDIKTLTKEHIESDNTGRIWIKKKKSKNWYTFTHPPTPYG